MTDSFPLSPIQLPNVSQVVYDILRKQIIAGEFAPGQQLNLRTLEAQLDVSRTPLKLALERLQLDGLIDVHPRRGTYVTTFSAEDIRESFQLRVALEAEALRQAFDSQHSSALHHIIRQFEEMDAFFQDEATWLDQLPEFMSRDRHVHLDIVALCGNKRMIEAYERANVQGYIAVMGTRFSYQDTLQTQREHRALNQALQSGNLPKLLEAARRHLHQAGERAVQRLAGNPDSKP